MKRATLTFNMDFPDRISNENAIETAIKVLKMTRNFPCQKDIKIEEIKNKN